VKVAFIFNVRILLSENIDLSRGLWPLF